ncbi:hypothetical protein GCM10011514_49610 [Emticicia aquatilis]|uniref:Uncharacterized protein n=1 Tax=Emticicia aquatilis TaxID=1537369 RepID=A0A916Z756_9BACT|nr:hypothetical protein [Emticicia aquatilis]GGD79698.1 hypothetical protein GCM10011514_49610 [Emticicia aquatilis]
MNTSNTNPTLLKSILTVQTIVLVVFTALVINNEGWTLFQIFINNITSIGWNGQFNLDFSCYLLLSGIWILWRNKYSLSSIIFAPVATIIGIIAFAPYLLYLLAIEKGDIRKVLLGDR